MYAFFERGEKLAPPYKYEKNSGPPFWQNEKHSASLSVSHTEKKVSRSNGKIGPKAQKIPGPSFWPHGNILDPPLTPWKNSGPPQATPKKSGPSYHQQTRLPPRKKWKLPNFPIFLQHLQLTHTHYLLNQVITGTFLHILYMSREIWKLKKQIGMINFVRQHLQDFHFWLMHL